MYTLNDFFCGCGGISVGFKDAGFNIVGAWDFDKFAVQTYKENVGDHVVQADITQMDIDDVPKADVWAFGFPCQDLSVAGKQAGIVVECRTCGETWAIDYDNYTSENPCPRCGCTEHKAANRSGMFFEIMRLLDEATERESQKLPLMLMAENVKALRPYLPMLEAEYAKRGYRTYYTMFNSKYWYVPQNRERYFVVGVRNDLEGEFAFPVEQHDYVPKLSSILETNVDEKYYISDDKAKVIIDQALKKLESLGYCHATITPDRVDKRQNGRRAKENEEEMFTLTAQDLHGVIEAVPESAVLRPVRTEYGKEIRKDYEAGKVQEKWSNIRELEPRPDGISNTLTTVLKDDLLLEVKDGDTENKPRIMRLALNGSGGQKGWLHCTEGIVGACTATDYKDPKYILEMTGDELSKEPAIEVVGMLDISSHDHSRRVHDPKGISPTVTAVSGGTHHIKIFDYSRFRVRKLTPTEYGRLQGFHTDTWNQVVSNSQAYKQFGNAVTTTVAKGIATSIIAFLYSALGGDSKCEINT